MNPIDKAKLKQELMEKFKSMGMKKPGPPKPPTKPQEPEKAPALNAERTILVQAQVIKNEVKKERRVETEEDFKKMPYEGRAKYDNELRTLNGLKKESGDPNQKPKKMFYEHYDEGLYNPIFPNNPNPSGRPPNIPEQFYEGIQVRPKRPWVYTGDENLPPVQCEEKNTFSKPSRKAKEDKKPDSVLHPRPPIEQKKPRKKRVRVGFDEDDQNDYSSNFEVSDSMQMSLDTNLVKNLNNQSGKKVEKPKSSMENEDEESDGDDFGNMAQSNQDMSENDDDGLDFNSDEMDIEDSDDEKKKPKRKEDLM